ncbi:MAG: hypothetical protein AVDCRST_MAG66-3608 [uncultured Pseudonocardia sp.]|uniref:Uncharacterized protein n=1 Tax=uncultured Pseudonocardia sp. TaxID=211455 RepID=A0A6J4QA18_9PSEU|nr:MAG: hypothetical protein AVDCRST_MAG66-3608 [uncultured Pseudonocardia sp.]
MADPGGGAVQLCPHVLDDLPVRCAPAVTLIGVIQVVGRDVVAGRDCGRLRSTALRGLLEAITFLITGAPAEWFVGGAGERRLIAVGHAPGYPPAVAATARRQAVPVRGGRRVAWTYRWSASLATGRVGQAGLSWTGPESMGVRNST